MGKLGTTVPGATAVVADLAVLGESGSVANGPEDLPDWDAIEGYSGFPPKVQANYG